MQQQAKTNKTNNNEYNQRSLPTTLQKYKNKNKNNNKKQQPQPPQPPPNTLLI